MQRKLLIVFIIALVITLLVLTPAMAANLVTNSSFEIGTDTDADNWTEGTDHVRSTYIDHSGDYSLRSNATSGTVETSQEYLYEVDTYYASVWIYRYSNVGTAGLKFGITGAYCTINSNQDVVGSWQYVSGSCVVETNTTGTIAAQTVDVNNTIFFDEICVSTTEADCQDNSTPTFTPTITDTPTFTLTPSHTPTETLTPTFTPTDTSTSTETPTQTYTPTGTLMTATPLYVIKNEFDYGTLSVGAMLLLFALLALVALIAIFVIWMVNQKKGVGK